MPTPKLTRSLITVVLLTLSSSAFAAGPLCADLFTAQVPAAGANENKNPARPILGLPAGKGPRALESLKQIKMMAYNVKDMFVHDHNGVDGAQQHVKPDWETRGVAQAIIDENPDFVVLEEVEGLDAVTNLSKNYLADKYQSFSTPGNDERGIQIGFLVKRDLPLAITIETHKDVTWMDPLDNHEHLLFSRDVPALMIRRPGADPKSAPALIFLGNHAKSQRDRHTNQGGFDSRSVMQRTAQMKAIAKIIDDYQAQYGKDVPIIIGGDFNIDVRQSAEVQAIRDRMRDPFDIKRVGQLDRVTHTFHSTGPAEYNQLDALFVTPGLADNVVDIEAYRYKDRNGQVKPLPQTYQERQRNPSDHFPIVVTLSTEDIFPEAYKKAN